MDRVEAMSGRMGQIVLAILAFKVDLGTARRNGAILSLSDSESVGGLCEARL